MTTSEQSASSWQNYVGERLTTRPTVQRLGISHRLDCIAKLQQKVGAMGLSVKQWLVLVVGGIAAGLLLSALLPHHAISPYSYAPRAGHVTTGASSATVWLPWVLLLGGFGAGVIFRSNSSFLTFAGGAMTAGLTLLTAH